MILVFAGAGASKAVGPENYPTTLEFFERLPEQIRKDPLFLHILSYGIAYRRTLRSLLLIAKNHFVPSLSILIARATTVMALTKDLCRGRCNKFE